MPLWNLASFPLGIRMFMQIPRGNKAGFSYFVSPWYLHFYKDTNLKLCRIQNKKKKNIIHENSYIKIHKLSKHSNSNLTMLRIPNLKKNRKKQNYKIKIHIKQYTKNQKIKKKTKKQKKKTYQKKSK